MSMNTKAVLGSAAVALGLSAALGFSSPASAEQVTFTKDVLPILQENCQVCHRPGGANLGGMVAPMAFTTYKETRPWAKAIAKAVATRDMPPWDASPEHAGVFDGERVITQDDIDTIVKWVDSGAARGKASDAPEPVEFPAVDGWTIGEPDLILSMPEPYFVDDDTLDETKYFPMKLTDDLLATDRWIKAVEFRPGSEAVHHIIATPFGGIAPGNKASVYREGFSERVHAGQEVTWNMHYHKETGPGTGQWDQSSVGVVFYPEDYTPDHVITTLPLGVFGFAIPPEADNYPGVAEYTFAKDALIVSMMPHMHYRGVKIRYDITYPDGKEEVLLNIPEYDFNWQTSYRFNELKSVPAGTVVRMEGTWDNSSNNPFNPDPSKTVTWGEATHEEMMFGWLSFTNVDEDATARRVGGLNSDD